MTSKRVTVAIVGALLVCLVAQEAHAWGPKAQRLITGLAIQRLKERYPDAFRSDQQNANFQADVLKGAADNAEKLMPELEVRGNSEADIVEAIGNQILLLRGARQFGVGSYYAYRMGALSALIADSMLPYSLDNSPQGMQIRKAIEADLETHSTEYSFRPEQRLQLVHNLRTYLNTYQPFAGDASRIIAVDYTSGNGYNGYLNQAGQQFFSDAIRATADIWCTIFAASTEVNLPQVSPDYLANYLVSEVEYLLTVKNNVKEATRKYEMIDKIRPGMASVYEKAGDLFHAYGVKKQDKALLERGVKEWERALDIPTSDRRRLSGKLGAHYLGIGKAQVQAAEKPGGYRLLGDALTSFQKAIEYDGQNDEAVKLLRETQAEKKKVDLAFETQSRIIDSATQVKKQAEGSESQKDYSNALLVYNKALGLFESVTDQFPDLKETATKQHDEIADSINTIKQRQLDEASDTIAKGDEAVKEKRFDEAVGLYQSVPGILEVIPSDPGTQHGKQKEELIAKAEGKVTEANNAKSKYEAEQAAAAQQAQQGGAAR